MSPTRRCSADMRKRYSQVVRVRLALLRSHGSITQRENDQPLKSAVKTHTNRDAVDRRRSLGITDAMETEMTRGGVWLGRQLMTERYLLCKLIRKNGYLLCFLQTGYKNRPGVI